MTHSEITWVCADCHPELPDVLKHEESETGETADHEETATTDGSESTAEKTVVTDGGMMVCPDCAGETINGQGLYDCLDCSWTGAR